MVPVLEIQVDRSASPSAFALISHIASAGPMSESRHTCHSHGLHPRRYLYVMTDKNQVVLRAKRSGGTLDEGSERRARRQEVQRLNRKNQEKDMATNNDKEREPRKERLPAKTPPVVSAQEWEAARQQLLIKEKALTRARDALAAERRRMPWLAVEKAYEFDGPKGRASLLDLFEGRPQLIVYRAFFEPGVFGWPEHACRGCSLGADQVAHLAHLNARDTTLVYASRAPQADIERLKARMGWEIPWYTITDSFDKDFGVDEWHGHNAFIRDGNRVFRTYFINNRGDEAMGTVWSYLDLTALGRQEKWEDSPEGYPQTDPYKWWNWHDSYETEATPDRKWVEVSDAGVAAFRKREAEAKA
jgi:predicted dithiol-disulfide oxidoreductase (DUF899 family)